MRGGAAAIFFTAFSMPFLGASLTFCCPSPQSGHQRERFFGDDDVPLEELVSRERKEGRQVSKR